MGQLNDHRKRMARQLKRHCIENNFFDTLIQRNESVSSVTGREDNTFWKYFMHLIRMVLGDLFAGLIIVH